MHYYEMLFVRNAIKKKMMGRAKLSAQRYKFNDKVVARCPINSFQGKLRRFCQRNICREQLAVFQRFYGFY